MTFVVDFVGLREVDVVDVRSDENCGSYGCGICVEKVAHWEAMFCVTLRVRVRAAKGHARKQENKTMGENTT